MIASPNWQTEMQGLIDRLQDGGFDDADRVRLNDLLRAGEPQREFFITYMDVHSRLAWEGGHEPANEPPRHVDFESESSNPAFPTFPVPTLSTNHHPLTTDFVGGPVFSYMVATVVLCAMLLGAWVYKISNVGSLPDGMAGKPRIETPYAPAVVGQITGMKDCRWSQGEPGTIVGASVPRGRKYSLESGLLQITYITGANVILEGPCVFKADSDIGGRLQLGKLVARVEKDDGLGIRNEELKGQESDIHYSSFKNHHLFTVRTPTAVVTDLGTEFGVEVDTAGNTTSHVFQGIVRFDTLGSPKSVMLRKSETASARIGPGGTSILIAHVSPKFVREIPRPQTEYFRSMPIKDSADFAWKYEMDVDPATQDLDGNSVSDWSEYWGGTTSTFDGVMRMGPNGGNEYPAYCSAASENAIWSNVSHATGFTFEIRVKCAGKKEWRGYTGAMYVWLSDENSDEYFSDLVVANKATLFDHVSRIVIDNNANDDGYHVFRVAQKANSGQYYIWRDNKLIYTRNGQQEKDNALRLGLVSFGNLSKATGPSEVDYVRLAAGAYAPAPPPASQNSK